MDKLLGIIGYAMQALDIIPKMLAAGQDISGYLANVKSVVQTAQDSGESIPDSAWDELKTIREDLQKRLHS